MSKLIVGCGYVGARLAQYWRAQGEAAVTVTSRSPDKRAQWEAMGFGTFALDVTQLAQQLPPAETVVFSVGYDRQADYPIEEAYVHGLARVLDRLGDGLQRFVYLSSTGVYGTTTSSWVNEESDCEPNRPGGRACLAAEQLLRAHPVTRDRAVVLRLAGIYGPGRLPLVARLRAGETLPVVPDGYLNLIHVDDVVAVIDAVARADAPPPLLCVSDGHPVRRGEFYAYVAEQLGLAEPSFAPPEPGTARAERSRSSKRIDSRRLREGFAFSPKYADYRAGLVQALAEDA